ncbi:MAG: polymer-forming cytoskeletal protein [Acidobacteriota bacterium]|nr:polymer-forming cytoskeletal protein [Acidobacteriota bacterium]
MIFKSEPPQGDLNGFLDAGSNVQGDLHFENTFRIDGKFTGKIVSDGTLVVGEDGRLEGEVEVGQIFVSGRVDGQIKAQRRVQIAPNGQVYADVDTPTLMIEDGALFEGRCTMSARKAHKPSAPGPAAVTPITSQQKSQPAKQQSLPAQRK